MAFSTLPAELHVRIAELCGKKSLVNLCLTSKWVNERYLCILYRHFDLQFYRYGGPSPLLRQRRCLRALPLIKRQKRFVLTLLSHPEYGKHVRTLKGTLCIPIPGDCHSLGEDMVSEEEFWRAIQSLTHVKSVDVTFIHVNSAYTEPLIFITGRQLPNRLFQSATSVTLVGYMEYALAKLILNAINPAMLKHLCLDLVQEPQMELRGKGGFAPGQTGEDGRIVAWGTISGLLKMLTGRCTALRTLMLRRIDVIDLYGQYVAAEEISYFEWASFIRSVHGTVEDFTLEQAKDWNHWIYAHNILDGTSSSRMNELFRQILLPAIVSRNWPCLNIIKLRGVRGSNEPGGGTTPLMELQAALGENVKIKVEEESRGIGKSRETIVSFDKYKTQNDDFYVM